LTELSDDPGAVAPSEGPETRRIDAIVAERPRTVSFEFFPPKTERGEQSLRDTIRDLNLLGPDFVSVTYGAGGSTRTKTREIVEYILEKTPLTAMAHLTCVKADRTELRALLDEYHERGILNILALRGDPPKGEGRFTLTPGGCANSTELLRLLQEDGRFATVCSAYPEGHPDSADRPSDWDALLQKFDAGACMAITQCFFVVEHYVEMMGYLRGHVDAPRVVPGVLPVIDFQKVDNFCSFCGAIIPDEMRRRFEPLMEDPVAMRREGIAFTIDLCARLLEAGAPGLHIYTLNRSPAAHEIVTSLRMRGLL